MRKQQRFFEEEEEEEELSLVSVLLARARESVFDLSLIPGKILLLFARVKGREDTNHHPRVLKERDRTERHRAGE